MQETSDFVQSVFCCCSFADQLSVCSSHIQRYVDCDLSAVVGTTYHDLRQCVEAFDISTVFECSFVTSQPSDVSSVDCCQSKLSDSDRQLSGWLICQLFCDTC